MPGAEQPRRHVTFSSTCEVPVKPIRSFTVVPSLPPELGRLRDLAYNLRWSWNHETIGLFRRLDRDLWETSGHNPVRMLGSIDQGKLLAAATDDGFRTHMGRVVAEFDAYLEGQGTWFERKHGADRVIAYFSAEFGLTECLSIFAGGLGVLAGDHLKSSSDLGCRWSASACSTSKVTSASISTKPAGSSRRTRTTTSTTCH
jgi:starch phosphorylase